MEPSLSASMSGAVDAAEAGCTPERMPSRPTPWERKHYYRGVRGELVAKTDTGELRNGWVPTWQRFYTIGEHKILSVWSEELIRSIYSALDGLEWQRFYPIRMGRMNRDEAGDEPRRRPILMVDVHHDTEDWDTAIQIALKCREILRGVGLLDMEVEIRAVRRVLFAMDRSLETVIEDWYWDASSVSDTALSPEFSYAGLLPFLSNIGCPIVPEGGSKTGTMGLHVTLSNRPSEVYGYTCRHVAHSTTDATEKGYWLANKDSYQIGGEDAQRHRMLQAGRTRLYDLRGDMLDSLKRATRRRDVLRTKKLKGLYLEDGQTHKGPMVDGLPLVEHTQLFELERDITFAEHVIEKLSDDTLQGADAQAIGHIAYMAPFQVSSRGFVRDWALIQLDISKFVNKPTNEIYVSGEQAEHLTSARYLEFEEGTLDDFLGLRDQKGKIRLQGFFEKPPPTTPSTPRQSFLVAKQGQRTGLTFGVTNEIKAVVRKLAPGYHAVAWEWIVVGVEERKWLRGDATPHLHTDFSNPGDSGAAVFDVKDRRVIGFVESGSTPKEEKKVGQEEVRPREHSVWRLWKKHQPDDEALPADPPTWTQPELDELTPAEFNRYEKSTDLAFIVPAEVVLEDIEQTTGAGRVAMV